MELLNEAQVGDSVGVSHPTYTYKILYVINYFTFLDYEFPEYTCCSNQQQHKRQPNQDNRRKPKV